MRAEAPAPRHHYDSFARSSNEWDGATPPSSPRAPAPRLWPAAVAAVGVAAVLFVVSTWAYTSLRPAMSHPTAHALAPSGYRWLQAWSWWDGTWYAGIADHGYTFTFGHRRQSAVAFFPAYPLLIRALTPFTGSAVLAGFLLTLACGIGASVLLYAWSVPRVGRDGARASLAALLLYPCSFYLFGTLYADALFLLLALAAFLFLEHDRPVLAGLAAAVATATRPIGLALVLGLWVRALERRGFFARRVAPTPGPPHGRGRSIVATLQRRDAGLLLAPLGFLGYCGYLWQRFGRPLLFLDAERGWRQSPGAHTWLKVAWFRRMGRPPYFDPPHYHLVGNFLVTVLALALVVVVFRRFGWGYAAYTLALVVGAALSTKDFVGMGRYVLSAFPCFAAAAALLSERARLRWLVFGASGVLLLFFTQLHARNMLIS